MEHWNLLVEYNLQLEYCQRYFPYIAIVKSCRSNAPTSIHCVSSARLTESLSFIQLQIIPPPPLWVIFKTFIHVQTAIKYFDFVYVSTPEMHFIRISAVLYFESLFFPELHLFMMIIPSLSSDNFYPQQ